ncbi:MAG TPA: DinB family protein [Streptosporangiaceae bacterium]|jgi:uncharacterized damage-inducible protein DinB|nr:DinB family protein [Streptosporangiaceae bacterium]
MSDQIISKVTPPSSPSAPASLDPEREDLLSELGQARYFLRHTARDLTDEQAGRRTTVSELSVGGLIKHVAATETHWAEFIVNGPSPADDFSAMTEDDFARRADDFRLLPGETLAAVLDHYAEVAARTDDLVRTLPDLNVSHPLPEAPWYEPGASRTARRVLIHIVAETTHHAGHADIIRESLDGAKTMA